MRRSTVVMAALVAFSPAIGAFAASAPGAPPDIWAKHGSYPPRMGNDVQILIDGQAAYSEVSAAMKKARKFVYGTFSYGDVDFMLVPETGETMFDLLRAARRENKADVKIVIWKPEGPTPDTIPDPAPGKIPGVNDGPASIEARWDTAPRYGRWPVTRILPFGCNHQKTYIMDDGAGGVVAFVGGINPSQSYWDTPAHDPLDARRVKKGGEPVKGLEKTPPLHDIFYKIKGPSVADVLSNFVERYNGASDPYRDATQDAVAPVTADQIPPVAGGVEAQIVRTIPPRKYEGAPGGDKGIHELYLNAINAAAKGSIVYIENQYFFDHAVIRALQEAAERGAKIIVVLTSKPDEGTSNAVKESFLEWIAKKELQGKLVPGHKNVVLMTLGTTVADPRDPGKVIPSEIYVHSKNLFVFNDDWSATAGGSANTAFTSMLYHAEMDVATMDAKRIKDSVARLWSEHLGISYDQAIALTKDPDAALAYFKSRSTEDKTLLDKGLSVPSRVFPFGTTFPARELTGVVPKNTTPPVPSVAAGPDSSSFNLPSMGLNDVKDAAGAPPQAPTSAPPASARADAAPPRALDYGVYAGRRPAGESGLRVDTVISLGEFSAEDPGRCGAPTKCIDSPFDAAFAKPRDKENLVNAFKAAMSERAAGRTVYFDSGVDDERAEAMAAALTIRRAACGRENVDKDRLQDSVQGALRANGFSDRYWLLKSDIWDWVAHPEDNAWLCEGASPNAG